MITLRILGKIVAVGTALLVSCTPTPVEAETSIPPTLTAMQPVQVITTADRQFQPITRPTATEETAVCLPIDETITTTRHIVVADVHYTSRVVDVQQRIRYANRTGADLNELVLNVDPNRWQNVFTLERVTVGRDEPDFELEGRRLTITLPEALLPDCEASLMLTYRLNMPLIGGTIYAQKGYFGYTERQMNLGHWLASVAPRKNDTWISRQAVLVGEQEVLDMADWNVTINLIAPHDGVTIAAPGTATQISGTSWRYTHNQSRDFSLSLSHRFDVTSQETAQEDGANVMVEVYSLNDLAQPPNAAEHALDVATRSLVMYADLFGAYPYERLLVVEGDFPDGMEFSGLVFVGSGWFTRYTGDPASYLTLITVHEVAHQWWYASVGNDPALTPWLDEALATYAEYIFVEEYYPELKDWWWQFRVHNFSPQGFVDSTVYEFSSVREYINAVYLRGVKMLHALREDLGTEAFFQLLYDYAKAGRGEIATPELFWSLLTPEQLERTQQTRTLYLRQSYITSGEQGR